MKTGFPRAGKWGLTLVGLFLSAGRMQATSPDGESQVTIPMEVLSDLRWIMALLIVILLLLALIALMLRVKDPSSLSVTRLLDFSGSYATDPETDHEYDGIRELDNPVPAWLRLIMYAGVAFGIVYVMHYHVLETGALQEEEYEMEMANAALLYKNVELPEDAIIYRDDERTLTAGQNIFLDLCQACHLADGGGSVGPNMTDPYWLHGGSIKDIYTTVTNGVPEKGMIAWNKQLTSQQRLEVSSFILSLQGTTPAVAKEPQGTLFVPGDAGTVAVIPGDSLGTDSLNAVDSTAVTPEN